MIQTSEDTVDTSRRSRTVHTRPSLWARFACFLASFFCFLAPIFPVAWDCCSAAAYSSSTSTGLSALGECIYQVIVRMNEVPIPLLYTLIITLLWYLSASPTVCGRIVTLLLYNRGFQLVLSQGPLFLLESNRGPLMCLRARAYVCVRVDRRKF